MGNWSIWASSSGLQAQLSQFNCFHRWLQCSAKTGDGCEYLISRIVSLLFNIHRFLTSASPKYKYRTAESNSFPSLSVLWSFFILRLVLPLLLSTFRCRKKKLPHFVHWCGCSKFKIVLRQVSAGKQHERQRPASASERGRGDAVWRSPVPRILRDEQIQQSTVFPV